MKISKGVANNTYKVVNVGVENRYGGGTYYFSSTQDPKERTACYNTESGFTIAMIKLTASTLLAVDGTYAKTLGIDMENIIPFAFPWRLGGPNMSRQTAVSTEVCVQRYGCTAMPQLIRGDVVLILSHIYQLRTSVG